MVKRKANGDDKLPKEEKMEIDGEDSGSDDVIIHLVYSYVL